MTEEDFEARVFNMLYALTDNYAHALTDNYPAGVGPSCVDVAARITKLSRDVDHSNTEGRIE